MNPSRAEILSYILHTLGELSRDWDLARPIEPNSRLFGELGFQSLDAVILATAIQEHYRCQMPFASLLADIGREQRDLSVAELVEFVAGHVGAPSGAEQVR